MKQELAGKGLRMRILTIVAIAIVLIVPITWSRGAEAEYKRFYPLEQQVDEYRVFTVWCDSKTGEQFLWLTSGVSATLAPMQQRCK